MSLKTTLLLSAFIVTLPGFPVAALSATPDLHVQPDRIEQHIMELSVFGRNPEGGVSRVAFSQADLDGREYITGLMSQAGLQVTIDTAGNLIGFRSGSENLPPDYARLTYRLRAGRWQLRW